MVGLSTRFRFFEVLDDWFADDDGPGRLNVWALGVACTTVGVDTFVPRGRNVLFPKTGRGVVSMSSSSSSEEVSGERSDS